jgi:hypothetical protein
MTNRGVERRAAADRRRDRLIREREHDLYKLRGKLPDPTACPECGAMYRAGRWVWGAPPADAHQTLCPACQRIRDDYPAGFLTLAGVFAQAHRAEILGLARNVEQREKGEHPLKRIMVIRDEGNEILIETTDDGLARNIGDALHRAYEGDLEYQYIDEGNLLRVSWRR